jgi:tetratricopeptide (TPR) repeat protein
MSLNNHNSTIFLTLEEAERVRKTLKGRLQKCQELAGQPRVPADPKTSLNQVGTASLLADIAATPEPGLKAQNGRPDAMVAFAVGNPYPPCTVLLQDLKPMKLSDLRMETHHRGHVLTVRRVAPVVKLVAFSWTVVQEESSGEMERLEILLHKSKHDQDILEAGSIFDLKEPYFTLSDQGEPTLRIDHPSDIVGCMDNLRTDSPYSSTDETNGSGGAAAPAALAAKTARECKEEGNTALKQKALRLAHANYTQGLQLLTMDGATKEDLTCDLFRNRSFVNLVLNRLDEAKADALASLTDLEDRNHKELDSKAYSRAGSAAYNLGEFQEAKSFFEEQQKLSPSDKGATTNLRRTELRLREQATGVYDFKKIKARLLMAHPSHPRVDATSFTHNAKIGESSGRGRGLFATRDMGSGEIILCEKAFCVVWGHEDEALTAMTYDGRDDRIRVVPAGLCKAIVQKLLNNPSQGNKVMDLYGDYRGLGKQLIMGDSGPVIDAFQVHDIVARNAFGTGLESSGGHSREENAINASTGLWILASYINHSCIPNAKREYLGDLMVLHATRPIGAGEEIMHSYDECSDYDVRTAALMNTWGFTCTCALCSAEKADSPALRKKRRELESEVNALVERDEAVGAKRLSIIKARRLVRSINDTYDDERYHGLPRMALLRIEKWLTEATSR